MWPFMQNEVQQGFLNLQLAVVSDQAQLSKFFHEEIYARPGRANHLSECLLVQLHG